MKSQSETNFSIEIENGEAVNGVFRDTKQGPVGVFVHGLLSHADGEKSMYLWNQAIMKNRSWIRFDLRGHGKSGGEFKNFRISNTVQDLTHVLDMVSTREIVLVGSSLGGWISAYLAANSSYKIRGALLIAPAFGFMEGIYQNMSPEHQHQWRNDGYFKFKDPYDDGDFTFEYAAVEDSRQFNIFQNNIAYQHPVIVLHGEQDDVVPLERSFRFQQHVSSEVQVETVPGGDHRLTTHVRKIGELVNRLWSVELPDGQS